MEPAERKSSVLSMMIRPVEEYEKEENSRRTAEIVGSRMIQDKLEKEKRSLVERASKGKAAEEEVRTKAAELAKFEPAKPLRLFVDDVTSEKLTSVLAENKGRTAVVSAESGIFSIMSGLYNHMLHKTAAYSTKTPWSAFSATILTPGIFFSRQNSGKTT